MSDNKKNKHLTLNDRIEIQECLSKKMSFKAIAKLIGKSPTTVSREVKLHAKTHKSGFTRTDEICPTILKAPFVCNGCDKKSRISCPCTRKLYSAKVAQQEYEEELSESRTGIPLSKESFYKTEKIVSDAVRKGQHVYHAIKSNNLPVSTATVYRHINKQYYSISRIDLPRAVKFKPRKSHNIEHIPSKLKQGRTYEDYLSYTEINSDLPLTQLDTVIGRAGGKTIMTIHFVNSDFMIGLLLENKTAAEVTNKIKDLKIKLNNARFNFGDIIPIVLTDNGGEFSNISAFENDLNGQLETHMFFCEPHMPSEKAEIEKNHTLFRDIVPKGSSFDSFTQETVNLIFSHVNAVKRNQFNGKSAYDMFTFSYSQELAEILGISFVPATDVIQSPLLLKK